MSGRVWAGVLLALVGCRDGCACTPPEATPRADALVIEGAERDTLELAVTSASWDGGRARIVASGARSAWVYEIVLEQPLVREGMRLETPRGGGRCRARYLREGKASEAELDLDELVIRELTKRARGARVYVEATCRKRFAVTASGTPHAAALPEAIQLRGDVTLSAP